MNKVFYIGGHAQMNMASALMAEDIKLGRKDCRYTVAFLPDQGRENFDPLAVIPDQLKDKVNVLTFTEEDRKNGKEAGFKDELQRSCEHMCTRNEEAGYGSDVPSYVFGDGSKNIATWLLENQASVKAAGPLISIMGGVRSEAEPEAYWVRQRQVIEPLCDRIFVSNDADRDNLIREGIEHDRISKVGNVSTLFLQNIAQDAFQDDEYKSKIMKEYNICPEQYTLLAVQQKENLDTKSAMDNLLFHARIMAQSGWPLVIIANGEYKKKSFTQYWEDQLADEIVKGDVRIISCVDPKKRATLIQNADYIVSDVVADQIVAGLSCLPMTVPRLQAQWLNANSDNPNQTVISAEDSLFVQNVAKHRHKTRRPNPMGVTQSEASEFEALRRHLAPSKSQLSAEHMKPPSPL